MCYTRTKLEKIQTPKTFCRTLSNNFHAKVWKVSPKNTTTWKIKSLTSSLDPCRPNKFVQITVLEATKMKQKSSMINRVHKNGATEECEKISTS